MFICYQYNCMELVESRQQHTSLPDVGLDGNPLELCFERLVSGEGGFSVACGSGYLRKLHDYVSKHYIFVRAAGGIVFDTEGKMLLMKRNDRWDLPKGKVEEGETLSQAALRETEEETGLSNLNIGRLRLKSYHIYNLYGGWHFKQTSWFDMAHAGNQATTPQSEEGITEVGWYNMAEWCGKLEKSYSTMQLIVQKVIENQREIQLG